MSKFEIGQRVFFCGYDQPTLYRKHSDCGGATVIDVRSRVQAAMASAASRSALYFVSCLCGHTVWTTTSSLDTVGGYRDRTNRRRLAVGPRIESVARSLPPQGSECERCGGYVWHRTDEGGIRYASCAMCGATHEPTAVPNEEVAE